MAARRGGRQVAETSVTRNSGESPGPRRPNLAPPCADLKSRVSFVARRRCIWFSPLSFTFVFCFQIHSPDPTAKSTRTKNELPTQNGHNGTDPPIGTNPPNRLRH